MAVYGLRNLAIEAGRGSGGDGMSEPSHEKEILWRRIYSMTMMKK